MADHAVPGRLECQRHGRWRWWAQPRLDQRGGHGPRDREHMAVLVVPAPRDPDAGAEEERPEEMESLFEAGDRGLLVLELEMNLIQPVAGNLEPADRLIAILREDEEIVGVANQLQARL